jgi:hypothetical protein
MAVGVEGKSLAVGARAVGVSVGMGVLVGGAGVAVWVVVGGTDVGVGDEGAAVGWAAERSAVAGDSVRRAPRS